MDRPITIKMYIAAIFICGLLGAKPGISGSLKASDEAHGSAVMARILVMPFQNMTRMYGKNKTISGPVTRKVFITQPVTPRAEIDMDQALHHLLSTHDGIQWRFPSSKELLSLSDPLEGPALIQRLQQLGRQNQTDGILLGYLYAYRERKGGDFGAETSARVVFEMALVRTENGAVVWQKGFSETQQPLNENLLDIGKFIKRKGRWVTAQEMGRQAMAEMLKTLPRQKPEGSRSGVTKDSQ